MKQIMPDNKIFLSDEFLKDKYRFHIIIKNLVSKELELYSDEENYIICRCSKKFPTWIWTKDNFDRSKLPEIENLITMYLTDKEFDKFTCKKELYDLLVETNYEHLNLDDYFEMGFLICNKTIKPEECDVTFEHPVESDRTTLEKYKYEDSIEMNLNPLTMEEAKKIVDDFLHDDKFYILRNPEGKIVTMANYSVVDNQAKIANVYTPPEERRKGYSSNLIYLITNEILSKGYIASLYTNYNYLPSNGTYKKVGYEDVDILINFSCSKEVNKVRN